MKEFIKRDWKILKSCDAVKHKLNLLDIIDRLHDIYLTHKMFGLPIYTSHMAFSPSYKQMSEGKKVKINYQLSVNQTTQVH